MHQWSPVQNNWIATCITPLEMERWPDLRDCVALEECWPKSLVRRSIDRRFAVVVFQFFSNTISFRRATFPPAQAIHFGVLQLTIYWSPCWSSRTGYRDLKCFIDAYNPPHIRDNSYRCRNLDIQSFNFNYRLSNLAHSAAHNTSHFKIIRLIYSSLRFSISVWGPSKPLVSNSLHAYGARICWVTHLLDLW